MKNRSQKSEFRKQKTEDRSKKSGTGRKAKLNDTVVFYILSIFCILSSVFFLLCSVSFAYEIHSKAAVVMDAATGKIFYAKNPDLKLPPASTAKLMTAILVIENTILSDVVTISKNASRVSPHKVGFKAGEKVTVETLLYAALLESANDAAIALAEAVAGSEKEFVELMNKKAVSIGAKNTRFANPHGLSKRGQYTTAYDLARIMNYALTYPVLREIMRTRSTEIFTIGGNALFLKNTNKLLWSEEDLIGGKTGYTRRARHCFVGAAECEDGIIIVTLLGSPSRRKLWKETGVLINKGIGAIEGREVPVAPYDTPDMKKVSYEKNISTDKKGKNLSRKSEKDKERL
ncbi:MAG: D-alanyl-D-alanine carboxypeptidase family protein [Nitrospirota bacterium]